MIELRTLGTLELTSTDGRPLNSVLAQPRRAALLGYLALATPHGFQRRDTLYTLFWPEHELEQARHALRQSLYFLRRALGPQAIVSRSYEELAIAGDQFTCDAWEFERAANEGRLEAALTLYRGDLLAGFNLSEAAEFERWLDETRARLKRLAAATAWTLAEARERANDPVAAIEYARRAAALSPGDETVLRRLLLLLQRAGDLAAAVRVYEAFARELQREYELEPSAETRALVARIRMGAGKGDGVPQPSSARPGSEVGLMEDLLADRNGGVFGGSGKQAGPRHSFAEEPKRKRFALSKGARAAVASVSLLALIGIGANALTGRNRAAVSERILVTDFANLTSDSSLDEVISYVLTSELARSPVLTVVGRATVTDALQRMRLAPGARLTDELVREVAIREEIKVLINGEVRPVGGGLVLTARVIDSTSGEILYGSHETAADSTELLRSIGRLANSIRRGIGESIASIRDDRLPPIMSLTTASLPALRMLMAGIGARGRGEYLLAVERMAEAARIDSAFDYAHVALAGNLDYAGLPRGRIVRPLVRVYQIRERLTPRERYALEGFYHLNVSGELDQAIHAFRNHVEEMLRMHELGFTGEYSRLLELNGDLAAAYRVVEELDSLIPSITQLITRARIIYAAGAAERARPWLNDTLRRQARALGRFATSAQRADAPQLLRLRAEILADSGRYEEAHALAANIRRETSLHNGLRVQAEMDAIRGRYGEAISHLRQLRDQALALGEVAAALEIAAATGRMRLLAGDGNGAAEVQELLNRYPLDDVDVLSRPYLSLALFFAEAGRPLSARSWLRAYEQNFPVEFRGPDRWMLHRAKAAVHKAEGDLTAARQEFLQAARLPGVRVGLFDVPVIRTDQHPELARVYEALAMPDSAIAVYERYLGMRSLYRTTTDAFERGNSLERLSALYAQRGDRTRAAHYAARLVALWRDADPPLAARLQAAR